MSKGTLQKKIAVVAGGYSGEAVISFQSAATVMENLDRDLYSPLLVRIDKDRWWVELRDGTTSDLDRDTFAWTGEDGSKNSFDTVFIMVHGTPGEDGILQRYFESLGLPITTGSSESVTGTFNKFATTSRLRSAGFSVGNSIEMSVEAVLDTEIVERIEREVGVPCFVKPNKGGSSLGISRVNEIEELDAAVELAKSTLCESIIIEELLEGPEYSIGILPGMDGEPEAMPITEIISENDFFDYNAKYEGASKEITPADLSSTNVQAMQEAGLKAYEFLECKGMVRIDFILINEKVPAILEINSVPGFSKMSILPQQLECAGITICDALTRVLKSVD